MDICGGLCTDCSAHRRQNRALDSLKLELTGAFNYLAWVLGTYAASL